jgi:hypothetical protein
MVVVIDGHRHQRRRWWDGVTMTQRHRRQWCLWPMVAAAMVVVTINCAAVVGATTTIPSLALTKAAKTPLPPLPSTAASIKDDSIAAVDGRHRRCRKVKGERRRWSLSMATTMARADAGKGGQGHKGKGVCVCFWPPVTKWGTVMHEIPISSPPLDDIPSIP